MQPDRPLFPANGLNVGLDVARCRDMSRSRWLLVAVLSTASCSHALRNTSKPPERTPIAQLWVSPTNIQQLDLFTGVGGQEYRPSTTSFRFVAIDTKGASPGYDVTDAKGVKWSVKTGVEVQPEIVVSRILWAIGFHQPPAYFVPDWTLTGGPGGVPTPPARFRPELTGYSVEGEWSWFENPFVGTRQFEGLIAANALLSNWDFKSSNNKVYHRRPGAEANLPLRMYIVRDLGASLGKSSQPAILRVTGVIRALPGTKSDIEGFEEQGFVALGENGRPKFSYRGPRRDLLDAVSVDGVVWMCQLMSRLSDRQLTDAFRAADYPPDLTRRFVKRIREKIAEGLALES